MYANCFILPFDNRAFLYGGDGTTGHVQLHGPSMDWLHLNLEI
jgi:hypothetical protein